MSASLVALAHGTNDAQKTMGVITLTLITAGALGHDAGPPLWVIASAGLAIALGTYLGGWRIIRTLGKRVTDIQTPQGFAAETSLHDGHPDLRAPRLRAVDHPGVHRRHLRRGPGRRLAEVRWGVAGQMVVAWLVTLPAAALVGGLSASVVTHGGNFGIVVIALLALAVAAFIVVMSRRNPVHASNVNETHEVSVRGAAATQVSTAA